MVDAHQTGTVRKHGFDLQQVDHVGDALHDVAFLQHAAPFITSSTVLPSRAPSSAVDVI